MIAKPWAAMTLVVGLSACDAGPGEQVVAQCELDAMRTYPQQEISMTTKAGNVMVTCMAAHGYSLRLTHSNCRPSFTTDLIRQANCYRPNGLISGAIWDFETVLSDRSTPRQ